MPLKIRAEDIIALDDKQLAELIAILIQTELKENNWPLSSFIGGGLHTAADDGIDCEIKCPEKQGERTDFIQASYTVFQIKQTETITQKAKIRKEMMHEDIIRPFFEELNQKQGAYIICCGAKQVGANKIPVINGHIQEVLDEHNLKNIQLDFYDADRIAQWVNDYFGAVLWIKKQLGKSLGAWVPVPSIEHFICGDEKRFFDGTKNTQEPVDILTGIQKMQRCLKEAGACVRLAGTSGSGKTAFVQALFNTAIGDKDEALPLGQSLYLNAEANTSMPPADVLNQLLAENKRAIMVVDNCPPDMHRALVEQISQHKKSKKLCPVSILTVEYDFARIDRAEDTAMFELQGPKNQTLDNFLQQTFPKLSWQDKNCICKFAGIDRTHQTGSGNFRIAKRLAEVALEDGVSLATLDNQGMLEKIIVGRQEGELKEKNMKLASYLSLLYSVNCEDDELQILAKLIGKDFDENLLYELLEDLRNKDIVQVRGNWRAVLPLAISNKLALIALKKIQKRRLDKWAESLSPRMQYSLIHRLIFLAESDQNVKETLSRWTSENGFLSCLFQKDISNLYKGLEVLEFIAPHFPEFVQNFSKQAIQIEDNYSFLPKLIGHTAFKENAFNHAVDLLVELNGNIRKWLKKSPEKAYSLKASVNNIHSTIKRLFQSKYSGTLATPKVRLSKLKELCASNDPDVKELGPIGLESALEINPTGFIENLLHVDIGLKNAHGWEAEENILKEWFMPIIELATDLSIREKKFKSILTNDFNIRNYWYYPLLQEALLKATETLCEKVPSGWSEMYLAAKQAKHHDASQMHEDSLSNLDKLLSISAPRNLAEKAKFFLLYNYWESNFQIKAFQIGEELQKERDSLKKFLKFCCEANQKDMHFKIYDAGRGLADTEPQEWSKTWLILKNGLKEPYPNKKWRSLISLCQGFLNEISRQNENVVESFLEKLTQTDIPIEEQISLSIIISLTDQGIDRIIKLLEKTSSALSVNFCICHLSLQTPPQIKKISSFLSVVYNLRGVGFPFNYSGQIIVCLTNWINQNPKLTKPLLKLGRAFLQKSDFTLGLNLQDPTLVEKIPFFCKDLEGKQATLTIAQNWRSFKDADNLRYGHPKELLKILLNIHPEIILSTVLLPMRDNLLFGTKLLESVPAIKLLNWAKDNPDYWTVLRQHLSLFYQADSLSNDIKISFTFIKLLRFAPDKKIFLGEPHCLYGGGRSFSFIGNAPEYRDDTETKTLTKIQKHCTNQDVKNWTKEALEYLERTRLSHENFLAQDKATDIYEDRGFE